MAEIDIIKYLSYWNYHNNPIITTKLNPHYSILFISFKRASPIFKFKIVIEIINLSWNWCEDIFYVEIFSVFTHAFDEIVGTPCL